MNNYSNYIEQIKKKLDAMNKASGFDPSLQKELSKQNSSMPSNDIFDMLGQGAKKWIEKNKEQ
jgi:hypothetical protein